MMMMSSGKFAFYLPICECKYKGAAAGGNNFSEGLLSPALSTAHGARSAAATDLRSSRCCDEVAAVTELRRPAGHAKWA